MTPPSFASSASLQMYHPSVRRHQTKFKWGSQPQYGDWGISQPASAGSLRHLAGRLMAFAGRGFSGGRVRAEKMITLLVCGRAGKIGCALNSVELLEMRQVEALCKRGRVDRNQRRFRFGYRRVDCRVRYDAALPMGLSAPPCWLLAWSMPTACSRCCCWSVREWCRYTPSGWRKYIFHREMTCKGAQSGEAGGIYSISERVHICNNFCHCTRAPARPTASAQDPEGPPPQGP